MSNSFLKGGLGAILALGLAVAPVAIPPALATSEPDPGETPPAATAVDITAAESRVIINEAYLNGGSANATYKNKYVELYNPTSADINLSGWSLQYRSATGKVAPTGLAPLSGTI